MGDGKVAWKTVVRNFWPDLIESVRQAEKDLEEVKIEDEVTDVICDVCGRNMVIKYGPHGKFLACPGFPECRNTKPYLEKIGVKCPKCGGEIILKKTKKDAATMAVNIIRSATSCPGRSRQRKSVRNAAGTCWKRETVWSARIRPAGM